MKIALNNTVMKSKVATSEKTIKRKNVISVVEAKVDEKFSSPNSNGVALLATSAAAVLKGSAKRNIFLFSSQVEAREGISTDSSIPKNSSSSNLNNSSSSSSNKTTSNSKSINSTTTTTTTTANSINSPIALAVVPVSSPMVSNKSQVLQIPSDILDDLASRFIINVPDVERTDLIRICFQIELAHWFYLDFFCAIEEKKLQPCGIKQFAMQLFQHIPFLRKHLSYIDKILDDWKNYKLSVPTYGAILISQDLNYVLLVQSYWAKSSWGFPKGKVNENEEPEHCATREVYEETGYDITGLIVPNDYIEAVINYQYTRLYIVRNVSLETLFSPRTRNEIKCCDWFPIDSLPINKNDAISKTNLGINANSFFMIMPFVKRLKKWVNDIRSGIETRHKFSSSLSSSSPIMTFNNANDGSNFCGILGQKNNCNNNNSCKKDEKKDAALTINDNNNNTSNSNNKRQRHKSMGDLDGIKLNLSNNDNNNTNSDSCNGKSVKSSSGGTKSNSLLSSSSLSSSSTSFMNQYSTPNNATTIITDVVKVAVVNSSMTTGAGKRNDKQNYLNTISISGGNNVPPPKRQLFHSHSQNGTSNITSTRSTNQCVDDLMTFIGGKKGGGRGNNSIAAMSSFDLIRKEKQQQIANNNNELKITNKTQYKGAGNSGIAAVSNANYRGRAKSQSSGNGQQQQMANGQQNQAAAAATKTTATTTATTQKVSNPLNKQTTGQRQIKQQTASGGRKSLSSSSSPLLSCPGVIVTNSAAIQLELVNNKSQQSQQQQQQQKSKSFIDSAQYQQQQNNTQKIQRMLSATNLKINDPSSLSPIGLVKSASTGSTTHHNATAAATTTEQLLKFNPNFDSWTNFSFTKNFIANVFC